MILTFERFRTNFDPHSVPRLLEDLLAFQNASHDWYSLGFELSLITRDELRDHLREESVPEFFGFGHDGTYCIYALWRYKEMPLDEAPVVYLNSEAEGSCVLTNNLAEFFMLLARDQEPVFGVYPEQEETEHTKRNSEFRKWLEERYYLHAAKHPNDVVRQAQHRHPAVPLIYTAG